MNSPPLTDGIRAVAVDDDAPAAGGSSDAAQPIAIAVISVAVLVAVAIDWESPLRTALTLGFVLIVPGLALTELLEIRDPVQRLALASAASLAIETLVAVILLYAGLFSAQATIGIVVALTCSALLAAALRRSSPARQREARSPSA